VCVRASVCIFCVYAPCMHLCVRACVCVCLCVRERVRVYVCVSVGVYLRVCIHFRVCGVCASIFTFLICKRLIGGTHIKVFAPGVHGEVSTKASTSLLLDKNGDFVASGEDATLKAKQASTENLADFNANFMYFEGFKMALKQFEGAHEPTVKPTMGIQKHVLVSKLMQVIFEQIKLEVYDRITAHSSVPISTVTWVITVPAMWSSDARGLMKKAAVEAGLLEPTDAMIKAAEDAGLAAPLINPILMPSEPEAAALYATQKDPVIKGERILVADHGGGTADFLICEIGINC